MRIVMFGKPGSGKGTQAKGLSRRLGLPHLSSGDILRTEIREGTALGKEVEKFVERGEMGPQELISSLILSFLERKGLGTGYILDGFPRTLLQASDLDDRYPPQNCILLDIEDDLVMDRLSKRLICGRCGAIYHTAGRPPSAPGICDFCATGLEKRKDDGEKAVRRRLEIFRTETERVVKYYRMQNRLITINGSRDAETVQEEIISRLE